MFLETVPEYEAPVAEMELHAFANLATIPRGSIYTTTMELSPKRPSPLWSWGPNSIIVVYMDPLEYLAPFRISVRFIVPGLGLRVTVTIGVAGRDLVWCHEVASPGLVVTAVAKLWP